MPLASQAVPLVFQGLDTKTDDRQRVVGSLTRLQNVILDAWPKLLKRPGYSQIAKAASGGLLASYKSQIFIGTGQRASCYTASGLVDRGVMEALSLVTLPSARDVYPKQTPDCAVHPAGITVVTYESLESGATVARYSVFDTATWLPIVSGISLGATAARPKPVVIGTAVAILFQDTSTNHLRMALVSSSAPSSLVAAMDVALDLGTAGAYDVVPWGGNLFVGYGSSAPSVKFATITPGFVVSTSVQVAAATTALSISVCADAAPNAVISWTTATNVQSAGYAPGLGVLYPVQTLSASPLARNITGVIANGKATILWDIPGSTPSQTITYLCNVTLPFGTGTVYVGGVAALLRSVGLASKAVVWGAMVHFSAAFETPLQPTYFLVSVDPTALSATIVGKVAPSIGGGLTARAMLPEASLLADGVTVCSSYLQADSVAAVGGAVVTQAGAMVARWTFGAPVVSQELSDDLHVTGGILWSFDGAAVAEHGFHVYPEGLSLAPSGAGSIFNGSYDYCAIYEWMDAQGLVHQSAPSPAVSVTTGLVAQISVTVPTLRLTSKAGPISVAIYRTIAAGTQFYRVTPFSAPILNSVAADTVTFVDTVPDATLIGNQEIYSNPGNLAAEVPNTGCPAPAYCTRYRTRVIVIPAETPYQWIYSKSIVPGVPVEFNAQQLYGIVEQSGGPLIAAAEMDDALYLFKADRIYITAGEGPGPNGVGADYATPQLVPSDCGCVNPRSLVLTPVGLMFQSAKGIQLLGRDRQVSYLGAPVEALNGQSVVAAQLSGNSRRVIFGLSNGVAAVYDYFAQKWATWTNHEAADLAVHDELLYHLRSTGELMVETPGAFSDNGAGISIGLTTGRISFAGLNGAQRVWRLIVRGDYRGPHTLTLGLAFDDSPANSQSEMVAPASLFSTPVADTTIADTDNPGGGAFPAYEWMVKVAQQRCSSIQLTIDEAQDSTTPNEGCAFSGVTFQVGVQPGLHRLPATRVI